MLGSIPGISKVYKVLWLLIKVKQKKDFYQLIMLWWKIWSVSKWNCNIVCVNGKSILDTDLCVSFTGNAGPDAMEGKPVGEVYIGIAYQDVVVYKLNLTGSRQEIASKAVEFAKKKIIEKINENLKKN